MSDFTINFVKLHSNARIPTQGDSEAAGYDLYACEDGIIAPFERKLVNTGLAIEIPKTHYGRIAPRSGLALKNGIDVMAGVIDSSYRNSVGVVLINLDVWGLLTAMIKKDSFSSAFMGIYGLPNEFRYRAGERIAQLIIEKCHTADWNEVKTLTNTQRNLSGFGSTGTG